MKRWNRIVIFAAIIAVIFALVGTTYSNITDDIVLGLDLQGGFEILYQVIPVNEDQVVDRDLLVHTQSALQKRINVLGVSEPELRIEGEDRIRVKLAGITDQEQARRLLATEANLSFRDTNDNLIMGGDNIRQGSAKVHLNDVNQPFVAVEFIDPEVTRKATTELLQKPMVIWLDWEEGDSYAEESLKPDHKFISAPIVRAVLTDSGSIEGAYTFNEAKELADLLNAGALPVTLEELSANGVSAKLGEQAMNLAVMAGIIGGLLIALYMTIYYRLPGLVASLALVAYVYLFLVVFSLMQATLTLPGIAALVLGIGTAVDANILTFERIKEEIRLGKSIMSAFKVGSKRALGTIMDANITSIIAAAVLFYFGSSAIQGFAVVLIVSIILSIVTAVFGVRFLLNLLLSSRIFDKKPEWFGVKQAEINDINQKNNANDGLKQTWFSGFNFVKYRRHYFTITGAVIVLGVVFFAIVGLNLGVDFTGGTQIEVMQEEASFTEEQVDQVVRGVGLVPGEIGFAGEHNQIARILFQEGITKEQRNELDQAFHERFGETVSVSETTVSADIAKELARQAVYAVLLAFAGIMIYITIRFELLFAVAAIISLFVAPVFTIIVFSLLHIEVDLTFIAAILTVVGYSINDTIVIFDRIREELKVAKIKTKEHLEELVNHSIKGTLTRSINTLLTILIAVLALYLFGGAGIKNFSFALLVGLLAGGFSSLFIAAQVWLVLKRKSQVKKDA